MRDDPALRFELCSSVSGVDYLGADERRLHVVYHLTSMTYRRRVRLEAAVTAEDPHLPSVTSVYPTADWQERETYDMFGVVFDGHPNLTRILMPDDWEGHPQRKDYPLGGVPVEYKGAEIPPPDQQEVLPVTHVRTTRADARDHRGPGLHRHRWRLGHGRRRHRPAQRRADRRQHGPAAPVHARRAPAGPGARGRDGHRGPLGRRLPAHRHREEPRVPQLGPGHHVRDPDGLPRPDLQRDGVLPRGGEAARHRATRSPSGPPRSGC